MNQYPSHSQTPKFDSNKSQTTGLYREPTATEMRKHSAFWVNLRDFIIFISTAVMCWLIVSLIIAALFGG